ncbi:MAG: hypothetical protein SGI88_10215 [Candidatus Hydrogenedentes bacterium]|nr:hypothetical protein [Candidatus Hydrogenedentota bacterium]
MSIPTVFRPSLRVRAAGMMLFVLAILLVPACPPFRTPFTSATVDLAVGDAGNAPFQFKMLPHPQILLYFDVLNAGSRPNPDVVLSGDVLPIGHPDSIIFDGADMYVGDSVMGTVSIWRDYRSIGNNQSADVVLGIPSGIASARKIALDNGILVVLDTEENKVLLFRHASTLNDGDAPDVVLENVGNARDMAVADGNLFVSSFSFVGESAQGKVHVFRDLATIEADAPRDVVLTGPSFLDQPFVWPDTLAVFNNHLFVFGQFTHHIFVFSSADDLVHQQPPDLVFGGPATAGLSSITSFAAWNESLFVANDEFSQNIGIAAYRPLTDLEPGQEPFALLDGYHSLVPGVISATAEAGALFLATSYAGFGDVQVFRRAELLRDGQRADIVIAHGEDVLVPVAVAAQES